MVSGAAAAMKTPLVTLTTDFGSRDGYVGALKGVILSRCPDARIVDIAHGIEPGDVAAAAFVLAESAPYFPPDSVHLAVIDPGVGSARRALAARIGAQRYVAPDNGLLTRVLARERGGRAVALDRPAYWQPAPSAVFHGRDIFAPVAGALAAGTPLDAVGSALPLEALVRAPWPTQRRTGEDWLGEIVYVDHFGNLISNLIPEGAPADGSVELCGRRIAAVRGYSDVAPGELLALVGSSGLLEVARRGGSAADGLGVARGAVITWRPSRG